MEFVNGVGIIPYMKWKIKAMFETTNQIIIPMNTILVGGVNPSEKYESQLELFFPIYGKIRNVPNHQPV